MSNQNIRQFEIVTKYKNQGINLPKRSTKYSAGYDIQAARDITIPSIWQPSFIKYFKDYYSSLPDLDPANWNAFTNYVSNAIKPTLVPTGIKVKMPKDNVLKIYNRSSNPLKRHLILANGVGIIDSDYYNNSDNEGEIFGQFLNFDVKPYTIKKDDNIMQGVFEQYFLTNNDFASNTRKGGFGSTDVNQENQD